MSQCLLDMTYFQASSTQDIFPYFVLLAFIHYLQTIFSALLLDLEFPEETIILESRHLFKSPFPFFLFFLLSFCLFPFLPISFFLPYSYWPKTSNDSQSTPFFSIHREILSSKSRRRQSWTKIKREKSCWLRLPKQGKKKGTSRSKMINQIETIENLISKLLMAERKDRNHIHRLLGG